MNQEDFARAFLAALSNEAVVRKLQSVICDPLCKQVSDLREIVKKKDKQIADLQEKIKCLEGATDELEQYSRRNSPRISGIIETEYEYFCEVTLNTFNKELKMDPPVEVSSIDRVHRVGP